jgi:hypothetical protein
MQLPALKGLPPLAEGTAVAILLFLMILKQGASQFYFALYPAIK